MIRVNILLIIGMMAFALQSCTYNVEEELYPTTECDTIGVTYSGVVLDIIDQNCYECHNSLANFGGITLEGYDNLKVYVDNGELVGVIKHEPGFSPMPQNQAQLRTCDIEKIEAWINLGAPNN